MQTESVAPIPDAPTEAQVKARLMVTVPPLEPLDDTGDLMTLAEWLQGVHSNFFTDYDGSGHFATEQGHGKERVCPTDITLRGCAPPGWATHVYWYNR